MLVDLIENGIGRVPKKIVHIGANRGGEAHQYSARKIIGYHVEAIPDIFRVLQETCARLNQQYPVNACLHFDRRSLVFNVASNFASSSVLELGRHAVAYPEVTYSRQITVQTDTVDDLIERAILPEDAEVAVLDVQGGELNVLRGATGFLRSPRLLGLVIEVSSDPLYEGGATYLQLCNFLDGFGFYTKEVAFNEDGWADAVFVRRYWKLTESDVPPLFADYVLGTTGTNIAPLGHASQSSAHVLPGSGASDQALHGARGPGYAFHTAREAAPWWMVDLGTVRRLDEIVIFNRIDEGRGRASGIICEVAETLGAWKRVWVNEYVFGGVDGRPLRIACPETRARFLRILGTPNEYLHLNKVEIYDHAQPPLA